MSSIPVRQHARKGSILLGLGIAVGAFVVGIGVFLGDLHSSIDTVKSAEDKPAVEQSAPAREVYGGQSKATIAAVSKPAYAGMTGEQKVGKEEPQSKIQFATAPEPVIAEGKTGATANESGAAGAATGAGNNGAGSGGAGSIGGGPSAPTAGGGFQASGGSGSAGGFNVAAPPRAMPIAPMAAPPVASPLLPAALASSAPAVPIPSPGAIITAALGTGGDGTPGGTALPSSEILRPGQSPGTAHVPDLTGLVGIEIEIAGPADGQYDVVIVDGGVANFPADFKISFILLGDYIPAPGSDFEFLFADALVGVENILYSFLKPDSTILPYGFGYQVYVDGDSDLHVRFYDANSPPQGYVHDLYTGLVAIPEPSTTALGLLGLALLGWGRLRARRQVSAAHYN